MKKSQLEKSTNQPDNVDLFTRFTTGAGLPRSHPSAIIAAVIQFRRKIDMRRLLEFANPADGSHVTALAAPPPSSAAAKSAFEACFGIQWDRESWGWAPRRRTDGGSSSGIGGKIGEIGGKENGWCGGAAGDALGSGRT
ncbi:hypothetical protein LWI28_029143 [Acer negundo]|uniref:Uncharacterized protein n=1 Tax=Acer negundo TaxID=4023 RepID=A0AAD5NJB8_ACENE|nr:hypothetical protein LWI28_029143 [Acer negundo]KAK4839982.1 hypothetical protein QYF36_026434 [Acer negundo]